MTITIHRGIAQIGGCITEIASASGSKILIDLGHNLPEGGKPAYDKYDTPAELDGVLAGVSDVYYTHYHGDHIGFEAHVNDKNIRQHIGALSLDMICTFRKHMQKAGGQLGEQATRSLQALENFRTYTAGKTEQVGDIRITPYYVSHSAIDAHMFLIECDGKKVLHMGDFRDHGYMGRGLLKSIDHYIAPRRIDVLITEGTMLSRTNAAMMTERELQNKAYDIMSRYRYVFAFASSMDADRMASFYHATRRHNGRLFVADNYQIQQIQNIRHHLHGIYADVAAQSIWNEQKSHYEQMIHSGFTMYVRNSATYRKLLAEIVPLIDLHQTAFVYSQFEGYINPEHKAFNSSTYDFIHLYDWTVIFLHTSGHANRDTLAAVCTHINPTTAIIPIHRDADTNFSDLDISPEIKAKVVTSSSLVNDIEICIC